jgi:FkbM family methyltransferase
MLAVLAMNGAAAKRIHPVNVALSDYEGTILFNDHSGTTVEFRESVRGAKTETNVTTLDRFVAQNKLTVGFVKADTEGHGWQVVTGGMNVMRQQRPAFSLSCYHVPDEMFNMTEALIRGLARYVLFWDMSANSAPWYHELVFMGYPEEALRT